MASLLLRVTATQLSLEKRKKLLHGEKLNCGKLDLLQVYTYPKGCFPLGGVFHGDRNFSL